MMLYPKSLWIAGLAITLITHQAIGQQKSAGNSKALALFANAADYQNGGAFELAGEEWEKLVKQFPNEAQASTAWHYLGICNLQRKEPNYSRAVDAFREALKDTKLELREESLINLSWALYSLGRKQSTESNEPKKALEEAKSRLVDFVKEYPDSAYTDQAIFYLGDIEHLQKNRRAAIQYFKRFLDNDRLAKSSLRPDALYALGVAYQDQGDAVEASNNYQEFLKRYADHSLAQEVRFRAAELLLSADKLTEAEALLKQIPIDKSSMGDLALLRLGYIYGKQGKIAEAAAQYEKLMSQFTSSAHLPTAALALGQLQIQNGKFDQAITTLRPWAEKPQATVAVDAAHWIAVALLRQNKNAEAADHISQALKKNPDSTLLRLDLADALYAQPDKKAEARKEFEKIANDKPNSPQAPRAAYNAAFVALESGDAFAAQQWAERFLANYPTDALRSEVAYIAAESLLRQGQHQASVTAYSKLIEADAKNASLPQWKLRQGMAHYLAGNYEQAINTLNKLVQELKDKDQKAEAEFIAGASWLYQDKPDQAVRLLLQSRASSDRWASADEALFVLGESQQRIKDNAAAKQSFQQLLQQYPQSRLKAQAQYKLAQIAAAQQEYAQAISLYRTLVDSPGAAKYHDFAQYGIAWCLMQQNEYQQAHDALQPLIGKNLQDSIGSEVLLSQGICLRKIGQADQAVPVLDQFLKRSPKGVSLANGLLELGLAHTELKQLDKANVAYERILQEVPDYAGADRVLYEIAWNLTEQEKVEAGLSKFAELASKFPRSAHAAEASYMVAQQLYDSKQYDQAALSYEKLIGQTQDPEVLEKSMYKLGWSHFQLEQWDKAAREFEQQTSKFPQGRLALDGLFMQAECQFKKDQFELALNGFRKARQAIEADNQSSAASSQVKTLVYLHAAQCLRELKQWDECEQWLNVIVKNHADSPYLPTALYELGFCKQNQGKSIEAITHYTEVASGYRNEVAARARFMLGELYFSQKDFVKAIPEFQRVMYGFGGDKAPEDIKNWQAKSAFEAARCSEVLVNNLSGSAKKKVLDTAIEFYEFIAQKHAKHELASQAQARIGELQKLR